MNKQYNGFPIIIALSTIAGLIGLFALYLLGVAAHQEITHTTIYDKIDSFCEDNNYSQWIYNPQISGCTNDGKTLRETKVIFDNWLGNKSHFEWK